MRELISIDDGESGGVCGNNGKVLIGAEIEWRGRTGVGAGRGGGEGHANSDPRSRIGISFLS
jgi:hypothetical protein